MGGTKSSEALAVRLDLLSYTPAMLWVVQATGARHGRETVYCNPVFYDATGTLPGGDLSQQLGDFAHPDDLQRLYRQWDLASDSHSSYGGFVRYRIGGTWRWHAMQAAYVGRSMWYGAAVDCHDAIMMQGLSGPAMAPGNAMARSTRPPTSPRGRMSDRATEILHAETLDAMAAALTELACELTTMATQLRTGAAAVSNGHHGPGVASAIRRGSDSLVRCASRLLGMAG